MEQMAATRFGTGHFTCAETASTKKSIPMQCAIWPDTVEAVCDLVGKLHCRLLQKVTPTYVREPQRISDVHEEGGHNGGAVCA